MQKVTINQERSGRNIYNRHIYRKMLDRERERRDGETGGSKNYERR